jgi:hypothetical protein
MAAGRIADMSRITLIIATVASLLVPAAGARADDAEVARRFVGSWVYAGGDTEQQARLDAIDDTVARMFGIARPFARRVMRNNTTNPSCFHIELDGDSIAIAIAEDDDEPLWTPLDGTAVQIDGWGSDQQVYRKVVGDTLHARSWQHNGGGTRVFRLSADGQTLTVQVIIDSQQLPEDMIYELTYRRE